MKKLWPIKPFTSKKYGDKIFDRKGVQADFT